MWSPDLTVHAINFLHFLHHTLLIRCFPRISFRQSQVLTVIFWVLSFCTPCFPADWGFAVIPTPSLSVFVLWCSSSSALRNDDMYTKRPLSLPFALLRFLTYLLIFSILFGSYVEFFSFRRIISSRITRCHLEVMFHSWFYLSAFGYLQFVYF